jgi:hypothetical protein
MTTTISNINIWSEAKPTEVVELKDVPTIVPQPEGTVRAVCHDRNCTMSSHWYSVSPKAVSGAKCWDCRGELVYNHRTGKAMYKGADWCICTGCTPSDLIANAKDHGTRGNRK